MIVIGSTVQKFIYLQYFSSNAQKFYVLMKVELCSILKLFLNFSNSEAFSLINFSKVLYKKCVFSSLNC